MAGEEQAGEGQFTAGLCSCGSERLAIWNVCEPCRARVDAPWVAFILLAVFFGFVVGSASERFMPSIMELLHPSPPPVTWSQIRAGAGPQITAGPGILTYSSGGITISNGTWDVTSSTAVVWSAR